MDLLAGLALRQFRTELVRKLTDRGLFQSAPRKVPPASHPLDLNSYDRFLKEESALRQLRRRKLARQNLAWVVAGILLPLLAVVLRILFF